MRRLPVFTLAVALLAALATFWPPAFAFLVYDRAAVQGGQWWRLATGHLVHYSATHLFINLLAFLPVGLVALWRGHRRFPLALLVSALIVGIGFYFLMPKMAFYAGLSGIVNAAYGFLFVSEIYREKGKSWLWGAALGILFLKSTLEFLLGGTFFVGAPETDNFVALPAAHLMGAVVGSIFGHWARKREPG